GHWKRFPYADARGSLGLVYADLADQGLAVMRRGRAGRLPHRNALPRPWQKKVCAVDALATRAGEWAHGQLVDEKRHYRDELGQDMARMLRTRARAHPLVAGFVPRLALWRLDRTFVADGRRYGRVTSYQFNGSVADMVMFDEGACAKW